MSSGSHFLLYGARKLPCDSVAGFLILIPAAFTAALPLSGEAQTWKPTRNVEIIAPSGAGGGSDEVARLVQRILQERKLVEVPLAVVNRPGAGGAIAWSGLNQHPG